MSLVPLNAYPRFSLLYFDYKEALSLRHSSGYAFWTYFLPETPSVQ